MSIQSIYDWIQPRYPEFKGQVAVITGSSRGIGKGIALRLAREGMKIVLHGIDQAELEVTADEFRRLGAEVLPLVRDFTELESVDRLFQQTYETFGGLHLLVNNAADLRRVHFFEVDRPLLDHQLSVNIRAPYWCAQRAAEMMRPAQRGNIINISSVGGSRAHWRGLPYDVTKGAIDAMTKAMALELAREGIRVNAIAPGPIRVERSMPPDHPEAQAVIERVPLRRYGSTLDVAAAVAFLASSDAAFITGQILSVDGGVTTQLTPPGQPV